MVSQNHILIVLFAIISASLPTIRSQHEFTIINNCQNEIWVGIHGQEENVTPPKRNSLGGGYVLAQGGRKVLFVPFAWQGRVWPRTGCVPNRKPFACDTGDCDNGKLQCVNSGERPATLAEFRFDGHQSQDFYDTSLVDGYNVGVMITPYSRNMKTGRPDSQYDCTSTGCNFNVNARCPEALKKKFGSINTCLSACSAFLNTPQRAKYCCEKPYDTPQTCRNFNPDYPKMLKEICPESYSYAYDDNKSTWTCKSGGSGYFIKFCP